MRRIGLVSFVVVVATVGVLSACGSTAQQPQPAPALQFEVAAIKPGDTKHNGAWSSTSGSEFRMVNTPLKQWVELGLSVPEYALKVPAWLDTSSFDLNAKLPAVKAVGNSIPEMMKALLIERFGLKWHEEPQTVSGYELVADKKVLVKPANPEERLHGGGSGAGPTSLSGTNMSMSDFVEALGNVLGKPVVDGTHISGGSDFKLIFRPIDDAAVAQAKGFGMKDTDIDSLPSIFDAVREQLGLRLDVAKVPSKVIVVDSINREPTAN